MRTTTAMLLTAVTLTALTGCSGGDGKEPAETTVTVTKTPELTAEEKRAECVDGWADTISSRPADWDPDVDDDPEPTECAGLPEDDWLDMYYDGLAQSNEAGREELGECLDDPACTSLPVAP